jgi:hypothetical protein
MQHSWFGHLPAEDQEAVTRLLGVSSKKSLSVSLRYLPLTMLNIVGPFAKLTRTVATRSFVSFSNY